MQNLIVALDTPSPVLGQVRRRKTFQLSRKDNWRPVCRRVLKALSKLQDYSGHSLVFRSTADGKLYVLDHSGAGGMPQFAPLDSASLVALLTEHMRFVYADDRESPPPLFVLQYILGLKADYDDVTTRRLCTHSDLPPPLSMRGH